MGHSVSGKLLVFLALLARAPGAEAVEAWLPDGLAGHSLTALSIAPASPGLLFAGTTGGEVFRSEDAAQNWSPASSGLPGGTVRGLAVHPSNPLRVYAGTDQGLYRTSDAGASWEVSGAGLPALPVVALAIDPVDPSRVWVSIDEPGLLHLYRTSDGGEQWEAITIRGPGFGTPSFGFVRSIAFRPGLTTIYASWHDEVFFSSDGGNAWGLTPDLGVEFLVVLPDPFDTARVYIGTGGKGMAASVNLAPWVLGAGLEGTIVPALAANLASPGTLYAATGDSVFRSTNHGAAWSQVGSDLPSPRALAVTPDGSRVWAATADGIVRLGESTGFSPRRPTSLDPPSRSPLHIDPRDATRSVAAVEP